MNFKEKKSTAKFYLIVSFLVWVLLFEFILPVNKVIPKPSVVLLSFDDLFRNYDLLVNTVSSIASIYFSLLIAYFFARTYFLIAYGYKNNLSKLIFSFEWISKYVPGVVLGLFLIYWFPDSEIVEFVFVFLAAFMSLIIFLQKLYPNIKVEYVESALTLGLKMPEIKRLVIWKSLQPKIMKQISDLHIYFWTLLIAFEYFRGGRGVGSVLRFAVEYNDISAVTAMAFLIGAIVYSVDKLFRLVRQKYFNWE